MKKTMKLLPCPECGKFPRLKLMDINQRSYSCCQYTSMSASTEYYQAIHWNIEVLEAIHLVKIVIGQLAQQNTLCFSVFLPTDYPLGKIAYYRDLFFIEYKSLLGLTLHETKDNFAESIEFLHHKRK